MQQALHISSGECWACFAGTGAVISTRSRSAGFNSCSSVAEGAPSPSPAPLMNALLPLMSQPPSTGVAIVARLAASLPLPGSVKQ
jgi:hypothetical protein